MTSVGIATAKGVLRTEADAILNAMDRIGPEFERAEEIIAGTRGRVIVSGLGKSGIIGRKIAATLSSVGVPSFFIHPVEGAHGDLGMIMRGDAAIIISKSGSSEEIAAILTHFKRLGVPVIAMTGNMESSMARAADVVLDISVPCEACPMNTVPTASTAVTAALGDALAISLFERKGLTPEDYAELHPGGVIGRKLTYRVADLMTAGERLPLIDAQASMGAVLDVMSDKKLGIAVITEGGRLAGVLTDGDLRRLLQRTDRPLELNAAAALRLTAREGQERATPVTVAPDAYAAHAANLMETYVITSLVVTEGNDTPVGVIRWIDLSLAGVV